MTDHPDLNTADSTSESAAAGESVGESLPFERTHAVLIRQPVTPNDVEAVRDRLDVMRPDEDGGSSWLLPGDDIVTVSLFLSDHDAARDEHEIALVWYIETTTAWTDPAATLRRRLASAAPGLGELVTAEATVYGAAEQAVHAHNPARPGRPGSVDVVLVRVELEPGVGTWLMRGITSLFDALDGTWADRKLKKSAVGVLEEERMWTETIYVDDPDRPTALLWYMEAEDMAQVVDVYETTDNAVARWSEVVLNRVLETPMTLLGDPMAASDYELLAHETAPERR